MLAPRGWPRHPTAVVGPTSKETHILMTWRTTHMLLSHRHLRCGPCAESGNRSSTHPCIQSTSHCTHHRGGHDFFGWTNPGRNPFSERLQRSSLACRAEPNAGGGDEAQHRSHPRRQRGLWGVRRLRRRNPARGSHAPYRPARQRRHASPQLQRRGSMHPLPFRANDGPLLDPVRDLPGPERGSPGRADAVGDHHL